MTTWPERLFDLVFISDMDTKLDELADLAEPESWDYQKTTTEHHKPILYNYLQYTFTRLAEEDKIELAADGQSLAFNTGLVTPNQESIFAFCVTNRHDSAQQNWFFVGWRRKGEHELTRFASLPEMADYYDNPSSLVFDTKKELRVNVEHIVADNKDRFPEPYRSMDNYALQTFLKGAIDNALERVKRNYKTAIPQYYKRNVQLLLPLCLGNPATAELAVVAVNHGEFYRASTCLTLDMAYSNARQLARPDRDWLVP
ncbi:MAG: DUF3825 domain-containing protein [Bacteroidales bacterium]|nr:DUF3825 domain-containing protein [Candidatus Latescibacterota bacterium]